MGVKGLWTLLDPAGKPVTLESLEGKVLAVDVSIWLHHLLHGMRDRQGDAVHNAHLLGLFTRVCKLLFYKIRPIFVFDGSTPELKRQTLIARRQARTEATERSEEVTRKLLTGLLKRHAVSTALSGHGFQSNNSSQVPGTSAGKTREPDIFELPPLPESSTLAKLSDDDDFDRVQDERSAFLEIIADEFQDPDDIDPDSEDFKSLPPEIRYELLSELREKRKNRRRAPKSDMPEESEDFSNYQISRMMKKSRITTKLADLRKEINHAASGNFVKELTGHDMDDNVEARQLVSDNMSHYVLIRGLKKQNQHGFHDRKLQRGGFNSGFPQNTTKYDAKNMDPKNSTSKLGDSLNKIFANDTEDIHNPYAATNSWVSIKQSSDTNKYSDTSSRHTLSDSVRLKTKIKREEPPKKTDEVIILDSDDEATDSKDVLHKNIESTSKNEIIVIDQQKNSNKFVENLSLEGGFIKEDSESESETKRENMKKEEADISHEGGFIKEESEDETKAEASVKAPTDFSQEGGFIRDDEGSESETKVEGDSEEYGERRMNVSMDYMKVRGALSDRRCLQNEMEEAELSEESEEETPADTNGNKKLEQIKNIEVNLKENKNNVDSNCNAKGDNVSNISKEEECNKDIDLSINTEKLKENKLNENLNDNEKNEGFTKEGEIYSGESTLENCLSTDDKNQISDDKDNSLAKKATELARVVPISKPPSENQVEDGILEPDVDQSDAQDLGTASEGDVDGENEDFVDIPSAAHTELREMEAPVMSDVEEEEDTEEEAGKPQTTVEEAELDIFMTEPSTSQVTQNNFILDAAERERLLFMDQELVTEADRLEQERGKLDRQAATLNDQITAEAQELLQLFGVPFLVSPTEAEAQCATLDLIGLTQGTITDDSDIWLFGGRKVYKNMFNQGKYVEMFTMDSIKGQLALDREMLINVAYLCGSDYTEGVAGVGPVSAVEILAEFKGPELKPLKDLKKWWASYKGIKPVPMETKIKSKIRQLKLSPGFPNPAIRDAYLEPEVDQSQEKFSWSRPDLDLLRGYASEKFGWSQQKADEVLLPVMKRMGESTYQTHINSFFSVNFEPKKMASKRLQSALDRLHGKPSDIPSNSAETKQSKTASQRSRNTRKRASENDSESHIVSNKRPRGRGGQRGRARSNRGRGKEIASTAEIDKVENNEQDMSVETNLESSIHISDEEISQNTKPNSVSRGAKSTRGRKTKKPGRGGIVLAQKQKGGSYKVLNRPNTKIVNEVKLSESSSSDSD